MRRLIAPVAAVGGMALAAWLAFGSGNVGYDTFYALLWGDQLSEGTLPAYQAPRSPTPHPLSNLVGLVLVPLGDAAAPAMTVLTLLAYGALGFVAYLLGRELAGWLAGALFAALLLTRPLLIEQALSTSIDVPFLALVLGAALLEVRRPRRGLAVIVLLGIAGLLRPEAWGLSVVYLAWLWPATERSAWLRLAGAAAVAPLFWIATDWIITGQPLYSFHQARATAERTGEQGGVTETIGWAARAVKGVVHPAVAVTALAGIGLTLRFLGRRAWVALALLALGCASFCLTGFAGLPLLIRYFFIGGTMLTLFAAIALGGWASRPRDDRFRTPWAIGAGVLLVVLLATAPYERRSIAAHAHAQNRLGELQGQLKRLAQRPVARAAIDKCPPVQTRLYRVRPQLLFLRRDERNVEIVARSTVIARQGLLLRARTEHGTAGAAGFRLVTAEGDWQLLSGSCPDGVDLTTMRRP